MFKIIESKAKKNSILIWKKKKVSLCVKVKREEYEKEAEKLYARSLM